MQLDVLQTLSAGSGRRWKKHVIRQDVTKNILLSVVFCKLRCGTLLHHFYPSLAGKKASGFKRIPNRNESV